MNIKEIPFSYFGSYMSISYSDELGFTLKSLRGKSKKNMDVLRIIPTVNNMPVDYEFEANYFSILIKFNNGSISICFEGDSKIVFYGKGKNVGLKLDTLPIYNFEYNYLMGKKGSEYCVINSYKNLTKFLVFSVNGKVGLSQNIFIDDCASTNKANNTSIIDVKSNSDNEFICVIEDIPTHMKVPDYKEYNFETSLNSTKKLFDEYYLAQPKVDEKYKNSLLKASYINWSSFVKPQGYLKRYTILASNSTFLGAWSWDHCFNALALAGVNDKLAFDQMAVLFDYQDEYGQIPGSLSDSTIRWNFTKPPIQGLFFSKMMKKINFTKETLEKIYNYIEKQVLFYVKFKDSNMDGIFEYHHGNDSGQDNSTIFKGAMVVDTPDLTAFIINAMDMLSKVAEKLNRNSEKEYWSNKADELTKLFLNYFIVDDLPVARETVTGEILSNNALLPLVSLVLGNRLPKYIRDKMIDLVTSERYLTKWGIATEAIDSDEYQDDAYWRGPIWAPTTLLFVEALEECCENELAIDIAKRYCELVDKNGFAENFNAITGEGLRDKSFTWTASTFIYLAAKVYEYNSQRINNIK
ncbi:amylo-alpha-1,6-glucosidase [Clostridioides difficile]|uniref:amylo-alpha-1,6-glucosidase n=1 Tax=Clostridioides difficile TaxID=1496 RepID=UPI0010B81584|nr:trehalase family glycosidase [Clostridioides difficile]MDV9914001.1 trehalase family glycosidase [Clostridioides difficile]VIF98526.1 cell wall surface anchor family protein [Clostridioides difficile]VIG40697.1 cell wall surface anchor family protein [Clostridioides difficile]VIH02204.1 cell wall surface anchor family protein [Clostridioides difficile]